MFGREACLALRLLHCKRGEPALLSNWRRFIRPDGGCAAHTCMHAHHRTHSSFRSVTSLANCLHSPRCSRCPTWTAAQGFAFAVCHVDVLQAQGVFCFQQVLQRACWPQTTSKWAVEASGWPGCGSLTTMRSA